MLTIIFVKTNPSPFFFQTIIYIMQMTPQYYCNWSLYNNVFPQLRSRPSL